MYFVYNHDRTLTSFSDLMALETALELQMWEVQGKALHCPSSIIKNDPLINDLEDELVLDYTFNPKRFHNIQYVDFLFALAEEYLGAVMSLEQARYIVGSNAVNDRDLVDQLQYAIHDAGLALPYAHAA